MKEAAVGLFVGILVVCAIAFVGLGVLFVVEDRTQRFVARFHHPAGKGRRR